MRADGQPGEIGAGVDGQSSGGHRLLRREIRVVTVSVVVNRLKTPTTVGAASEYVRRDNNHQKIDVVASSSWPIARASIFCRSNNVHEAWQSSEYYSLVWLTCGVAL
jgi:hypothetical protein